MNFYALKNDTLYKTTDYSAFEMHVENRDLLDTEELESSMKRHGYISAYPLHCIRKGNRLVIKAGHHRFYSASRLGIPVWFVITSDIAGLTDLEVPVHPWTTKSYLQSRARAGDPNYIQLMEFQKQTGLRLSNCASPLGGQSATSGNKIKEVKHLKFKVKSNDMAYAVADLIQWLSENGIRHAKNSRFVGAISKVMQIPEFDVMQFRERVLVNKSEMPLCATEALFIENIAYVYNKSSRVKIPLTFLVSELMKERQVAYQNK